MRILVTGATGFVGQAVVARLHAEGHTVRVALRLPRSAIFEMEQAVVGELGPDTHWLAALENVDAVVHCAARAHVMNEQEIDPRGAFMRVNAEGTARLVREAVAAGVGRFVFVSSVGVYGINSHPTPISENQALRPQNPYGESKVLAEQAVSEGYTSSNAGAEACSWVCLRPPLIHGPGAPGNLYRLREAIRRGWPLPFAAVRNRRSLLGLDHLSRVIAAALAAPELPDCALNVADHETVSTPEIIHALATGAGRRPRMISVPPRWMRGVAAVTGRTSTYEQLCESLIFDTGRLRTHYGDLQPCSTLEGLEATGASQ